MRRDCGKKRWFIRCEEECGELPLCMFSSDRVISCVTRRVITRSVLYALLSDIMITRGGVTHSPPVLGAGNALSRRIVSRHVHPPLALCVGSVLLMQLRPQTSHRKQHELRDAKVYCSNLQSTPGVCADCCCIGFSI